MVTLEQAKAAGLAVDDVQRLCRTGRWRRLARSAYLIRPSNPAYVERRARIRAAVSSLGPDAVAVLTTAAEVLGIAGVRFSDRIHVSVPGRLAKSSRASEPGLVVHQMVIPRTDTGHVARIAVTSPLRTVADTILRVGRYDGVSVLDSALNIGLIVEDDLLQIPALISGRRGAVAARTMLPEADCRAQSPLETRVRLRCVDGRVAPETLQHEIRDVDGHLLGIADMAWPSAGLLAEADGRGPHGTPEAVFADRRRQNRLVNAGWQVLRFTWRDTLNPSYIPATVRAALRSRRPAEAR
jgi:hypothetical protein